jgi:DNA-binding CsgD family transcriptional regulator
MTPPLNMRESVIRSKRIPATVAVAAEAVIAASGDPRRLTRVFARSHVPMFIVDGRRRFMEANRPTRLAVRLTLEEMRTLSIDDLTPIHRLEVIKQLWARLLDTGCIAGHYQVAGADSSRLEVVYYAVAQVLPGLHLIAFAPADWPDGELEASVEADLPALTPREIELMRLTADGLSGPELARALWVSPTTVNSHFKNIYEKLDVGNRSAAVAKAMRFGLIE